MILRFLAAVSFTMIGGIVGFSMADKLNQSRKICGEIGYLFQRTSFFITYRQDDVYTICRSLKSDSELKNLTFIAELPECYRTGEDFRQLWDSAVRSQKNIDNEEAELLLHLGAVLGKSNAESQAEAIAGLTAELERITQIRTENLLKKGRLYRSAGLLFGVMAGIIVI